MPPDIRSNRSSERLLRRLDQIEERRDTLLGELDALREEDRARRPEAEVWSVNEVVEHMVRAERYVLRALFDDSVRKDRPRTLRNRILHRVVIWILKGPISVKVPGRDMDPTGDRSLEDRAALTPGHLAVATLDARACWGPCLTLAVDPG